MRLYKTSDPASESGFRAIPVGPAHPGAELFWPVPGMALGFGDGFIIAVRDLLRAIADGRLGRTRLPGRPARERGGRRRPGLGRDAQLAGGRAAGPSPGARARVSSSDRRASTRPCAKSTIARTIGLAASTYWSRMSKWCTPGTTVSSGARPCCRRCSAYSSLWRIHSVGSSPPTNSSTGQRTRGASRSALLRRAISSVRPISALTVVCIAGSGSKMPLTGTAPLITSAGRPAAVQSWASAIAHRCAPAEWPDKVSRSGSPPYARAWRQVQAIARRADFDRAVQGHRRAQVVVGDRGADALAHERLGDVREIRLVLRAPVAAVEEHVHRRVVSRRARGRCRSCAAAPSP